MIGKSITFFLVLMVPSFACADAEVAFFLTGTFEYQLNALSDPLLRTGCTSYSLGELCTGRNPRAEFKLGAEFAFGDWHNKPWRWPIYQFGYKHRSAWFSGKPFNDEGEFHSESLFLEFKFGGLR